MSVLGHSVSTQRLYVQPMNVYVMYHKINYFVNKAYETYVSFCCTIHWDLWNRLVEYKRYWLYIVDRKKYTKTIHYLFENELKGLSKRKISRKEYLTKFKNQNKSVRTKKKWIRFLLHIIKPFRKFACMSQRRTWK